MEMHYFRTVEGEEAFLNLEEVDQKDDGSTKFSRQGVKALKLIRSLSHMKPPTEEHLVAVELIFDEGICISPYTIFKQPLHKDICRSFNEISQFGCELRMALEAAGAFAFIDRVSDKQVAWGTIERILSVFSVCASGFNKLDEAPTAFVHAVVDFFRTSDGMGWNREVLGASNVSVQCVSNVVIGLAKVFNESTLLAKSRKHKSALPGRNPGWHAFQHSNDSVDQELLSLSQNFREDSRMRPGLVQAAIIKVASWIKKTFPNETVREVVLSAARPESFTSYLAEETGGKSSKHVLSIVEAARKLSISISEQLVEEIGGMVQFDLVSQKEVDKVKNQVKRSPKPSRARSRPLPEKLIPIMKEILDEGANGWPGKNFRIDLVVNGKVRNLYCPVIPTLFRTMLDIPLRMGQIRRLDSGEGDVRHFNGDKMKWEKNNGPLAGFWADLVGEPREDFPTRGYAIEIEDEIKPITGLWVNTNKTGDPFAMPWHMPAVFKRLWGLRKWQQKFNPIKTPVGPEVYLDAPQDYPESTKAMMPNIFPLSRLFPTGYWPEQGRIVTSSEIDHAWGLILLEIQHRWNKQHPGNQVTLVDIQPKTGRPCNPRYNIHGLRVRGLTNLRRGGMPLDLLSKFIAGHASLAMTIFYTEPHPSEIADAVEKATARFEAQRQFINDLKRMKVDEALRRTVSLSPSAVRSAIESASQFEFCNAAIGVCPYDGSRCGDGGDLIRKDESEGVSKGVYGPVEPRNCVVCRHFISGPPWMNELTDFSTKLAERRQYLSREESKVNELAAQYDQAYRDGTIGVAEYENRWDELGASMQQLKNEQESVDRAMFYTEVYVSACVKLYNADPKGEAGLMLVTSSRSALFEYREVTEFEQAVRITFAGRVYKVLGDERVERKRDDYCDLMMFNSGVVSPRMRTDVSPEHRRWAMDQYCLFISARASRAEIAGLAAGTLRYSDLGIEEQVRNLLEVSLSEPILLSGVTWPGATWLGVTRRDSPPAVEAMV
ncbi:VPA1269 family protein [Mesorhizobium sp. VK24D]|uniref:VPA1269 family protein n=1 Tax=Mesorhizobium album TaxID=3072314 RepID=A0ABU4XWI8_9HYPH|nr:VPA1269 family protein [Mesorhizobium sp. VK24D]MDX8479057.1 VPA1269 family protein [Mesorhizobium sp. VK24D]